MVGKALKAIAIASVTSAQGGAGATRLRLLTRAVNEASKDALASMLQATRLTTQARVSCSVACSSLFPIRLKTLIANPPGKAQELQTPVRGDPKAALSKWPVLHCHQVIRTSTQVPEATGNRGETKIARNNSCNHRPGDSNRVKDPQANNKTVTTNLHHQMTVIYLECRRLFQAIDLT